MLSAKSLSTIVALLLLQAAPTHAWTSSFTSATNPEGDDASHVTVNSLSGDAMISFSCAEGMIVGYLENRKGATLNGPGAVYADGTQIAADGYDARLEFSNTPQIVGLARQFMAANGNVEVRYGARTTPRDIVDAFPATGATRALRPLLADPRCGVE